MLKSGRGGHDTSLVFFLHDLHDARRNTTARGEKPRLLDRLFLWRRCLVAMSCYVLRAAVGKLGNLDSSTLSLEESVLVAMSCYTRAAVGKGEAHNNHYLLTKNRIQTWPSSLHAKTNNGGGRTDHNNPRKRHRAGPQGLCSQASR